LVELHDGVCDLEIGSLIFEEVGNSSLVPFQVVGCVVDKRSFLPPGVSESINDD
jgi:hypothetical protein